MSEKLKMPIDAVVAVTYSCNSRCVMCNIWQIQDFPEMPPEAYLKLPRSLRDINISGGEPFLREDLVEIIKAIKKACPKANLNISTNGFLVDRIKKVLPQILKVYPKMAISVSLDGIGQMHEEVRRVPKAWPKVLETIRFCRQIMRNHRVKMAFTLNELNYHQLGLAYEWADRLGVDFTMAVAHSSDIFFSADNEKARLAWLNDHRVHADFKKVIGQLLSSLNPKDWVRAYFVNGLYDVSQGKRRPLQSFGGEDFFYLDPKGDVYPSVVDNVIMGNINDYDNFLNLWFSSQAEEARGSIAGFENNYWMVCTARTAIKRNPLKVANWIFKNKLKWN